MIETHLPQDNLLSGIDTSNPQELVGAFMKSPNLHTLYESDAGVWERYTIKQHSIMALTQFERYFADSFSSPLVSRREFEIMLAVHDIGKPQAIRETGNKRNQHEYTARILPNLLKSIGIEGLKNKIMVAIPTQDFVGEYVKDNLSLEDAVFQNNGIARDIGVPASDLMDLILVYYSCDAGSYTVDAGGLESLDYLFEFTRSDSDGKGRMDFSERIRTKMDHLKEATRLINA